MDLILKIAWRNILRHRGKSLIIGAILFLGAVLMTFGNGVISGMDRGLEKNIVNGFLGDIVIISSKEKSDNILFKMFGESIESITNYPGIRKSVEKEKYIKGFLPIGKNVTLVLNEEDGDPGFSMVLGVEMDKYRSFFPDSFMPIEGRLLKKGETGIILPKKNREALYDQMNNWLIPEGVRLDEANLSDDAKENKKYLRLKNNAVFMGMSDGGSTTDIRLPVKGIIRFNALNTIWGHFAIMDIESYRQCLGYFSAEDSSAAIPKEKKKILSLNEKDLDASYGTTDFIVADKASRDYSGVKIKRKKKPASAGVDLEKGAYNMVLVKLAKGISLEEGIEKLNSTLAGAKLGVRAVTWKNASGFIGSMATIIKGALFVFVMLLFMVAIIIIVNTLTMAAIERTTEIGMMRAVGARKGFISGMFLGETVILSFLFGGIGIIVGIIAVNIIPMLNISSANDLIQLLFGGDTFHPYLSPADIIIVIFELALVTLITSVYPIRVAKNITPLDAIARD
jgi:ABC-type lipoprotein release transport system permease subunit